MHKDKKENSFIGNLGELFSFEGYKLKKSVITSDYVTLFYSWKKSYAFCPCCGKKSVRRHSKQLRHITDVSVSDRSTRLEFECGKYFCSNPSCEKKIFVTRIPGIRSHARRTDRFDRHVYNLGCDLTFRGVSRQLAAESMHCSTSTCGRVFKSRAVTSVPPPRYVGIDDFAYKKGLTYGSVMGNLEDGSPVDLIGSRDVLSVSKWIDRYPSLKCISSDGSIAYRKGIEGSSLGVIRVRDRFHLIADIRGYMERGVKRLAGNIRWTDSGSAPDPDIVRVCIWRHIFSFARKDIARKYERYLIYNEMQTRGHSVKSIAKKLGIKPCNAWRHRHMQLKANVPHTQHSLYRHMEEIIEAILDRSIVCEDDICRRFPDITPEMVKGLDERLEDIRRETRQNTAKEHCLKPPSVKEIFKTFFTEGYRTENESMKTILARYPWLQEVIGLCRKFREMMNGNKAGHSLGEWIEKAKTVKMKELKAFAKMISLDYEAVENAVKLPWNNGTMEGLVNKIKVIKRMMYGRASFELLRLKLIARYIT